MFTWVKLAISARQKCVRRGEEGLHIFTLVASEAALRERFAADPTRGALPEQTLTRLRQARALATLQIDTTGRPVDEIANELLKRLGAPPGAHEQEE